MPQREVTDDDEHLSGIFLTLLGWIINNGIWNLLIATGMFSLPLVIKVVGIWLKVREEGDDEGNKGKLSLPHIENALYCAFFMMLICCLLCGWRRLDGLGSELVGWLRCLRMGPRMCRDRQEKQVGL